MSYRSVFRDGLFAGKAVLITGGGSGIGRCTAHELASLGARIALAGRRVERLQAVAEEIHAAHPAAHVSCHACDIRDEEQVRAAVGEALEAHDRVDGLFNNAGGQYPAPLESLSLKGWESVLRNNLTGGFLVARECHAQWMRDHGGAIVNMIADIWGGMPGMGHSGAARAGMLSLTETAACEWGPAGIRVNAVAPGWIASSGLDTYDDRTKALVKGLRRKVPLARFGTESEVSAAVVFLLSDAAAFITGACLRIDGGVPNARPTWPLPGKGRSRAYNGFSLYRPPTWLVDDVPLAED